MSAIVDVHGWDVLLSTADACCIQLLHDVSDGLYIAVGCTLHSFHQLEQLLLSLCSSVVACCQSTESQPDMTSIASPADDTVMSSSSAAAAESSTSSSSTVVATVSSLDSVSVGSSYLSQMSAMSKSDDRQVDSDSVQSVTTLQASANCKAVNVDSQFKTSSSLQQASADPVQSMTAETTSCHRQLYTRSGRLVKSRKLADFTLSDVTFRQTACSAEKTCLKQRQGQGRHQGQNLGGEDQGEGKGVNISSSNCSDHVSDVLDTCSSQGQTNDQQTDVTTTRATAVADDASYVTTDHGIASFFYTFDN